MTVSGAALPRAALYTQSKVQSSLCVCCVNCLQVASAAGCNAAAICNPPVAAAKEPEPELEWGPGATSQNLAAYEAKLQVRGPWAAAGPSMLTFMRGRSLLAVPLGMPRCGAGTICHRVQLPRNQIGTQSYA